MFRSLAFGILVLSALDGCTPIAPWERGILAKSHMSANPAPLRNSARQHIYGSREAGASSSDGAGGGCGCY